MSYVVDLARSKESIAGELVEVLHDRDFLLTLVIDLYYNAHRKAWEPGETTDELCDRVHSELCNRKLDPYTNGGPASIQRLRKKVAGR